MGSISLARDQTHVPRIARWILNHWTTREVPSVLNKIQNIVLFIITKISWCFLIPSWAWENWDTQKLAPFLDFPANIMGLIHRLDGSKILDLAIILKPFTRQWQGTGFPSEKDVQIYKGSRTILLTSLFWDKIYLIHDHFQQFIALGDRGCQATGHWST